MKSPANLRKSQKLRPAILAALGLGWVTVVQPAFGDSNVTFDGKTLRIPVVLAGEKPHEVVMVLAGQCTDQPQPSFKFCTTKVLAIPKLTFVDSEKGFQREITFTELKKVISQEDMAVFCPTEESHKTSQGLPMKTVFDKIYGNHWREREEVRITTLNGESSSISVDQFVQHNSILLSKSDADSPCPIDSSITNVDMPLFLVWDNINSPELNDSEMLKDGYSSKRVLRSTGWVWQVAGFELVKFAIQFPNAVPPPGSSEQVQRGFEYTRIHCMRCHQMNGDGYELSRRSDLNDPISVTKDYDDALIKQTLLEPGVIIGGKKIPRSMLLPQRLENRDQVADDIIAYLKAIAQ